VNRLGKIGCHFCKKKSSRLTELKEETLPEGRGVKKRGTSCKFETRSGGSGGKKENFSVCDKRFPTIEGECQTVFNSAWGHKGAKRSPEGRGILGTSN